MSTKHFLSAFGMETLRDLPDIEALEDAGLLNRIRTPGGEMPDAADATSGEYNDESVEYVDRVGCAADHPVPAHSPNALLAQRCFARARLHYGLAAGFDPARRGRVAPF
ncbi:hypothetical protein IE4872_PD01702 (plasmid) [Rhizobium gallicum]|uniref:Uncharacterized protein n=1 Tax=Rhizobium gallicum TaxID=56730 RepID=A0A1L5NWD4_9HYPH|nr:hypothetical protein IE4872_PD01702 [Rhizobium gallicum]